MNKSRLDAGHSPFRASTHARAAPVQQHSRQQDAGAPLIKRDVDWFLKILTEMFDPKNTKKYDCKPEKRNKVDQDKVRGIGFRFHPCNKHANEMQKFKFGVTDEEAEDKRQAFANRICQMLHYDKPDFKWAAMAVQRRRPHHKAYQHKDYNNSDKHQSCIIGFSEERDAACELHLSERGEKLDIKDRFVMFDGKNEKHGPVEHMKGARYSVVFYTPQNWHRHCDHLNHEVKDWLREKLAFQLPLP